MLPAWIGRFAGALARGFAATWRVRVDGAVPPPPAVLAFAHGDGLALAGAAGRRPISVLVSRSADGAWAARALSRLGLDVVRGSSSRGAVAGARALLARLRAGRYAAIAVDGPRGPAGIERPGARALARIGGVPLVALAATARPSLRLRSWDRALVPLPFARVTISVETRA